MYDQREQAAFIHRNIINHFNKPFSLLLFAGDKNMIVAKLVQLNQILDCTFWKAFSIAVYFSGVSPPGHLLSTAEVESALVEHKAVAEAAVVSRPHPVKGESLYCFVTLTDGVAYNQALEAELRKQGGSDK